MGDIQVTQTRRISRAGRNRLLYNLQFTDFTSAPSLPEGKTRSAQNARRHGFAAAEFIVVRAEHLDEVADIKADLVAVYHPVNSEELSALERVALTRHTMLRASRLEAGLFSSGINEAVDTEGAFRNQPSLDITVSQGLNHALADGFVRLVRQSPEIWKLFLRYQAQAGRNYRQAIQEFDRLKSLRDELPNEPVIEPEPAPAQPVTPPPNEPVPAREPDPAPVAPPPPPPFPRDIPPTTEPIVIINNARPGSLRPERAPLAPSSPVSSDVLQKV